MAAPPLERGPGHLWCTPYSAVDDILAEDGRHRTRRCCPSFPGQSRSDHPCHGSLGADRPYARPPVDSETPGIAFILRIH